MPREYEMDDEVAIKVEYVSKKYCKSLKRSMLYGIKDIGRNILGMSSYSENLRKDEFWALNDISFEVKKGETLGIIGPNGSGKTTLLKLLNGIFWPDKGKITIKGKVGALIEVGAGFHPLLTGRENIYINAAILGMTKKEVDEKFDDIIEFADIGDFIDAPVKFYSSGMFVRLGFAVAVHCKPDVLLVDEVLAVGDMNFRSKCLDKIREFRCSGKAIILVSHNIDAVSRFCDNSIWLENGVIKQIGDAPTIVSNYCHSMYNNDAVQDLNPTLTGMPGRMGTGEVEIQNIRILNHKGRETSVFETGDSIYVEIHYFSKRDAHRANFGFTIYSSTGVIISVVTTEVEGCSPQLKDGERGIVRCYIKNLPFLSGIYLLSVGVGDGFVTYDLWEKMLKFQVIEHSDRTKAKLADYGLVTIPVIWDYAPLKKQKK